MRKDIWISPQLDRIQIMRLKHPLTHTGIRAFRWIIYRYYEAHGRSFSWRDTSNPYHIIVSEVMLQQTQTDRVVQKYRDFIGRFPDFESLATASVRNVLNAWIGLGYNRRALALQKAARIVVDEYHGSLPADEALLLKLPGIGTYSASAIVAFAFNKPSVFVETNIRTVFTFFFSYDGMTDRQILDFVKQTIDISNPREWYYALFDYGAMLKKWLPSEEKHKVLRSQPPFVGSDRQIRGAILKTLIGSISIVESDILRDAEDRDRIDRILGRLQQEGFIVRDGIQVKLAGD